MFYPTRLEIPERGKPAIDLIFAVLLLISTLSTAVCVYQATRWNGIQAIDFGESAKFRTESIRATTVANSQVIIDVQMFLSWVNARGRGEQEEAAFIEERFREEFRPAFDAWRARAGGDPANPVPMGTPFELPEYSVSKYDESASLEENASAIFTRGTEANRNSDRYISITVLFAIVLFFCGVYSKWESPTIRAGLLLMALGVFSVAFVALADLLIRVGYI